MKVKIAVRTNISIYILCIKIVEDYMIYGGRTTRTEILAISTITDSEEIVLGFKTCHMPEKQTKWGIESLLKLAHYCWTTCVILKSHKQMFCVTSK